MVHQVWTPIHHSFDQAIISRTLAFDHIARDCPRATRKTNKRDFAVELAANKIYRIKNVLQLFHIRNGQTLNVLFSSNRMSKLRAFAVNKIQTESHGMGNR